MLYGNYRLVCRMETDAFLPGYKGSTFRGVFGHALKNVVCAFKRQECGICRLQNSCFYYAVFETASLPHPFVIEPPRDNHTEYRSGERFTCNLLLFGEVNHRLPYFVYAFEQMGQIGIGKKQNGSRGRYQLKEVWNHGTQIYNHKDRVLQLPDQYHRISLEEPGRCADAGSGLKVLLQTPLRFKFKGRLADGLPFHILVRSMLRRISSLLNAYGAGEPQLDYQGLVKKAQSVHVIQSNLRWQDWGRYSNRQNRRMLMGGLSGSIAYGGRLHSFLPLLDACSKLHIGKQTTFGLGKIALEAIS